MKKDMAYKSTEIARRDGSAYSKTVFGGYFAEVIVDVGNRSAAYLSHCGFNAVGQEDSVRLRDTAGALLAAADLLDSLQ